MSIDPRLMERRRDVAEDRANRNVRRLVRFLAVVLVIAGGVWLVHSPWLSVSQVGVEGARQSDANATLAELGVVAGIPMYRIDSNAVAEVLLEDPWIEEVDVSKDWPKNVAIRIDERVPVAWTLTSDGWARRAHDGVAVPSGAEPDDKFARIEMPELLSDGAVDSPLMLGALEFVGALDAGLRSGSTLTVHESELWATVDGFQVRLGRPVEMAEKARSLGALLQENLAAGSVLILIAPTNPSVQEPTPDEPSEETDDS